MPANPAQQKAIRITAERDGNTPVVLHPGDDDLFIRTGKQVIDACRLGISIELWLQEFNSMLAEVSKWTADRSGQIKACFCTPRGARIVLFFIPASGKFDFDLADELVELNGHLIKAFNVGMVEIHQIPWGELDRFLNVDSAKQVYGPTPGSPSPVEA